MTVDGRVVPAWFRWEYETGQTQGITNYRSAVAQEIVDCNKDATKVVVDAFNPERNLKLAPEEAALRIPSRK
jgi:hypothetical protein